MCGARELAEFAAIYFLLFLPRHDELRLGHDGGELAVGAGDPGLPHHGGAAAVKRRGLGLDFLAERAGGEEVGLALDRRGGGACRQVEEARGAAEIVGEPITAPPCSTPLRLVSSSRTTSSDTTRSGDTWVNVIPKKRPNGGWASTTAC